MAAPRMRVSWLLPGSFRWSFECAPGEVIRGLPFGKLRYKCMTDGQVQ
jgi:hypothetical protein